MVRAVNERLKLALLQHLFLTYRLDGKSHKRAPPCSESVWGLRLSRAYFSWLILLSVKRYDVSPVSMMAQ